MSAENFDRALKIVLGHEGGYVNHPKDPGGETNLGITRRTWESWVGRPAMPGEMRSLTPDMVRPIYRQQYWDRVRGDDLPSGADLATFDAGVNSGTTRGARWLQEAVGARQDGVVGPQTLAAAAAHPNKPDMVAKICDLRLDFLMGLSHWGTFGRGWGRRVGHIKATGMAWAGASTRDLRAAADRESAVAKRESAGATASGTASAGSGAGAAGTAPTDEWAIAMALACLGIFLALVAWRLYRRSRVHREVAREIERVAQEADRGASTV
ncbi:glycoside hydrolase family 108 protein [Caldimonas sp.]|uniref:glycoside hydrolase family 108 protein n=1 Tax=Caldimonas sp. TaxID=2838790 RepID=UPI00391B59CA